MQAVVASRLVVWASALAALAIFGYSRAELAFGDGRHYTQPFRSAASNFLLAPAARWDSTWYLTIAHVGYFTRPSTVFFPLYPLLLHIASPTWLGSALIIGALISLGSFTVALYLLYRLTALDLGDASARLTVLLVAVFPTSFFLSAVYTEALFLMLSVAAIYAARLDRWAWAGVLGCLAGAARPDAILVAVPLVLIFFYGPRGGRPHERPLRRWQPHYRPSHSLLWLGLVPLGVIAYMIYLQATHGAPFAPFQGQAAFWGRRFAGPFGGVVHLFAALPHALSTLIAGHARSVGAGDPLS